VVAQVSKDNRQPGREEGARIRALLTSATTQLNVLFALHVIRTKQRQQHYLI
jgi:hypothetical protein